MDEALKYAQKAVELDPARPSYADTLGWILYRKGLYTAAIPYLEKGSTADRSAVGKYHLAMAYAKTGDKRDRTVLAAALKQNPRLPEAKTAQEIVGVSH
jgi:predicted Zn-dependent protease